MIMLDDDDHLIYQYQKKNKKTLKTKKEKKRSGST